MPRPKPLSNRQRRLQEKAAPKAPKVKPALAVVPKSGVEPRGVALREAIAHQVEAVERQRLGVPAQVVMANERGLHGYLRATSRDGLFSLHKSGTLDDVELKAGVAFRLAYEACTPSMGSCLEAVGGASRRVSGLARSAAELHRAYLLARLNQMERAVAAAIVDGRELHALRLIAGEGKTLSEVAGSSGQARDNYRAALKRALAAVASALRITGN